MPTPRPLVCAFRFVAFHRVNEWLHSDRVRGVIFLEIHHVEFVSASFRDVSNGEEVPLRVVESVMVEVQEQVVLVVVNLSHLAEVARLKLCVKEESLLVDPADVDWVRRRLKIMY